MNRVPPLLQTDGGKHNGFFENRPTLTPNVSPEPWLPNSPYCVQYESRGRVEMDGWDDATMQRQPAIHRRPTTPRKTIHQSIPSALSPHGRCISPAHPSKPRVSLSPSLRHPYTNIPSSLLSNTAPSESVEHSAAADMQPQPGPTQIPQHSATQASRTHDAAADAGLLTPKRACDPVVSGLRRHRPDDDPGYAYSGPRSPDLCPLLWDRGDYGCHWSPHSVPHSWRG